MLGEKCPYPPYPIAKVGNDGGPERDIQTDPQFLAVAVASQLGINVRFTVSGRAHWGFIIFPILPPAQGRPVTGVTGA